MNAAYVCTLTAAGAEIPAKEDQCCRVKIPLLPFSMHHNPKTASPSVPAAPRMYLSISRSLWCPQLKVFNYWADLMKESLSLQFVLFLLTFFLPNQSGVALTSFISAAPPRRAPVAALINRGAVVVPVVAFYLGET